MNENEKEKVVVEEKPSTDATAKTVAELTKAYKELQENSVSKEQYNELAKVNSDLVRSVIDGGSISGAKSEPEETPDIKELAKATFEEGIGNLEYAKRSLKLREAYIKKFEKDPFAPNHAEMTQNDINRAEAVAEVMQECIEESGGSESVYTALFNERINADSPQMKAALSKRGIK